MSARKLLLLSNSTTHGGKYLEWAREEITSFLSQNNVSQVMFIPYALQNHDEYTKNVEEALKPWGFGVYSIHGKANPTEAVEQAEAIFIGGGNTFLLLRTLYGKSLIPAIRKRVLQDGMPYIGSSAGTNVATVSIKTTNDMPIVYPPSFDALNLVPFNINPHYIDPDCNSKHMGETQEMRIQQYHEIENTPPVLGLREGSMLLIEGDKAVLKGLYKARLFRRNKAPEEYEIGSNLSFLLSPR